MPAPLPPFCSAQQATALQSILPQKTLLWKSQPRKAPVPAASEKSLLIFSLKSAIISLLVWSAQVNTEVYRSGHNGPDSKSGSLHGLVGSNPTASATPEQALYRLLRLFLQKSERTHAAAPPFPITTAAPGCDWVWANPLDASIYTVWYQVGFERSNPHCRRQCGRQFANWRILYFHLW